MITTIDYELEIEYLNEQNEYDYKYFTVEFKIEASYGNNGIGGYEYWGIRCRDDSYGWELEDISWDESKYTEEENEWIKKEIEKGYFQDKVYNDLED